MIYNRIQSQQTKTKEENQMNRIPDRLFETTTPDEVAECMPVSSTLYSRLWNDIVPMQYRARNEEESECDYSDANALVNFWHLFSAQERAELNKAARKYWVEVMGADD